METKQETCAERIGQELADREAELHRLYAVIDSGDGMDLEDEAYNEINEMSYGIEVKKVYKVIWSGGGPADWIEITTDSEGDIEKVEYIYQDWYDGARKQVEQDSSVWRYAEGILEMMSA
jgi:hypothetical protein